MLLNEAESRFVGAISSDFASLRWSSRSLGSCWAPSLGREPLPWTEARPHTGLAALLLSALRLTRPPPPSERHKSVYPPGFRRLVPPRSLYVYYIIYIYKLRGGLYIYII